MNWIEVAWTMIGSASVTLGVVYLFVWFKQRSERARLWFFALAVSVPTFGAFELLAMKAATPAEYAVVARWAQVPLFVVITFLVGFVHTYFGTGRGWLAYATVGTRALALLLNFTTGVSVLQKEVTGLARVELWGGAAVLFAVFASFTPGVQQVLRTTALGPGQWALSIVLAFLGTFWIEARKWLVRTRAPRGSGVQAA